MASTKTTTDLIKTVLRRASIPNDQSTFTDQDLLDIMNEEFMSNVLPVILKVHEEYYVYSVDVTVVAGQNRYPLPYRSIGNRLRELHYIDSSGNSYNMTRISLEDVPDYGGDYNYTTGSTFYVQNDEVVLLGDSGLSGTIRMYFYMRPNQLVLEENVPRINSIVADSMAGTTTLTLASFPSDFQANTEFDIIAKRSPNKLKSFDIVSTAIDANLNEITFTSTDLPSDLAVGDFLAIAEESHIPQLPVELLPILSQRTAIKCLESMGDTEGMSNASNELQKLEMNAFSLIDNRVEGAPRKVVNRTGHLRNGSNYLRRKRRR